MKFCLVVLFFQMFNFLSNAQSINTDKFLYISPVPNSKLNSAGTNIIIRYNEDPFNSSALNNQSGIIVKGNRSGIKEGEIILTSDNRTLIFKPYSQFTKGETVEVRLNNFRTINDKEIPPLVFSFEISSSDIKKTLDTESIIKRLYPEFEPEKSIDINSILNNSRSDTTLPEDFPNISVSHFNKPAEGYFFVAPFISSVDRRPYIIIMDNYGTPVFYRKIYGSAAFDFKKQDNGLLTYYNNGKFYVMDSSYSIVDSLYMQNGYSTDTHECLILENKHVLMMSYDPQVVNMDTIVPGGQPDAIVIGLVIQELDENRNVVFQWRSWDHFEITDATYNINLTGNQIDYVHGNSIEVDYDGNILISCRHMDEVTKINRQSGEIIWRLGGMFCENNQFTFLNDTVGFSHQHDVRRLENGNILLFDNGNLNFPGITRTAEFHVDEENKTAMLVWEHKNNPLTFSPAMGSSRRIKDERTVIGWGWSPQQPSVSEVSRDGTINLNINLGTNRISYRTFKFPWKTNLFTASPDTLFFLNVTAGDSLTAKIIVTNNSDQEIEINRLYNRTSEFYSTTTLPVIISPSASEEIEVTFKPAADGDYIDDLHIQWNREEMRIAQVVALIGSTDSVLTNIETEENEINCNLSQNYPNPFNPVTTFEFHLPSSSNVTLKIYDVLGNEIETIVNEGMKAGRHTIKYDGSKLSSGVYYYRLITDKYSETKTMILPK